LSDVAFADGVGRVHVPKAADVLAERLREQILSGRLREGDQLPAERELVEQTGLGRSSVREALRVLENQGLISKRTGRNGGSLIRRPDRTSIESSIDLFIRGQKLRFRSLLETREAIEPASARLAALHRTDDDIQALSEAHRQLEAAYADVPTFLIANVRWHLAVVDASHNELLIAFMTAISQAMHAGTDLRDFNSDEVRTIVIKAHHRVFEAIRDRDPDAARRRMERHVGAYCEHVRRKVETDGTRKGTS
jgi:DNA-binding FadR family transcriptional regulator